MALEGDLQDITLTSLVQMICLEQRQAALILQRPGEDGIMFFAGGEIVHATAGPLEGEEAAYRLLSWTHGSFYTKDQVSAPRWTIRTPVSNLLLEAARRLDDQKAQGTASATGQGRLSPADAAQDSALENDLILLLSRLERLLAQLTDKKNHKQPTLALSILAEMVNQVAAFSEERRAVRTKSISLAQALAEASVAYPQVRLLPAQNNRLSAQTIARLYSSWAGDPAGRRETFRQAARGLCDVLETYFAHLTARFRSPALADQWRETCGIFLNDLTPGVDKIQF